MAVSPRLGCLQSNAQNHTMQQPSRNIQKPSDVGGLKVYIAKVALYFLGSSGMSTGPVTIKKYQKYIYKLHKGTYPSRWGTILKSPILKCFCFLPLPFFQYRNGSKLHRMTVPENNILNIAIFAG